MRIALIPCAATDWHAEHRLLGRTELAATESGLAACATWIETLRPLSLTIVYHGPDELSHATARAVAKPLHVRTRALRDLAEADLGLWVGLTDEQLALRYQAAAELLRESPLNVAPPEGEPLADVARRIETMLGKQLQKRSEGAVGFVARPLVLAIFRYVVHDLPPGEIWEHSQAPAGPVVVDYSSPEPTG